MGNSLFGTDFAIYKGMNQRTARQRAMDQLVGRYGWRKAIKHIINQSGRNTECNCSICQEFDSLVRKEQLIELDDFEFESRKQENGQVVY